MDTIERPQAPPLPLENGDRLTRAEFERRWEAMPHVKKAELIDGVVYMPTAVRYQGHGSEHLAMVTWLGVYKAHTPGVGSADNTTNRLDEDNEPQPAVLLRLPESAGGQSYVDEDGYLNRGPELVAEVAASSASYDLHQKLNTYRRHSVREYIVWRVLEDVIDWFVLCEGNYDRLAPDADGVYKSRIFPGLWLDSAAIRADDLLKVLETLHSGLATPEHAEFVSRLRDSLAK